jgi:hypothetical protein
MLQYFEVNITLSSFKKEGRKQVRRGKGEKEGKQ